MFCLPAVLPLTQPPLPPAWEQLHAVGPAEVLLGLASGSPTAFQESSALGEGWVSSCAVPSQNFKGQLSLSRVGSQCLVIRVSIVRNEKALKMNYGGDLIVYHATTAPPSPPASMTPYLNSAFGAEDAKVCHQQGQ